MNIPGKIASTFIELKRQYPFRIALKGINGKYYVYKERGVWVKEKKKTKIISEYLGRITDGGIFVKKTLSAKDDLENAKALITDKGGEIIWHERKEPKITLPQSQSLETNEIDLKLLTILSMNARLPTSKIAAMVGIKGQAAHHKIKALEKRFGIKYILELDIEKLGYNKYLVLVKFEEEIPKIEELEEAFLKEPSVQFAAATKGKFDLIMYILGHDIANAIDSFRNLVIKTGLGNYKVLWNLVPFAQTYSFIPIRDLFVESALKNKEWKRSRINPTPKQEELMHREFMLLKELNTNSNRNFLEVDKRNNLHNGTARYAYQTLVEEGIILRSTITTTNVPIKYNGIILISDLIEKEVESNRYKFLFDLIEYGQILNKYSFLGNIGTPIGAVLFLPVMNEGELDNATLRIKNELGGVTAENLIITKNIVGSLCYRRFDNDYSRQYRLLIEYNKTKFKELEKYD